MRARSSELARTIVTLGGLVTAVACHSSATTQPTSDGPGVKTAVARQDAEGLTEAAFTPEYLKRLEALTVSGMLAQKRASSKAYMLSDDEVRSSIGGSYVTAGPHKLAVLRTTVNGAASIATIHGIVGGEYVRVVCMVDADIDVSISAGPCDEKIREVFGYSINPLRTSNG